MMDAVMSGILGDVLVILSIVFVSGGAVGAGVVYALLSGRR